jgi:hypothetical protein
VLQLGINAADAQLAIGRDPITAGEAFDFLQELVAEMILP